MAVKDKLEEIEKDESAGVEQSGPVMESKKQVEEKKEAPAPVVEAPAPVTSAEPVVDPNNLSPHFWGLLAKRVEDGITYLTYGSPIMGFGTYLKEIARDEKNKSISVATAFLPGVTIDWKHGSASLIKIK